MCVRILALSPSLCPLPFLILPFTYAHAHTLTHTRSSFLSFSSLHRYDTVSPSMVERGDWSRGDDRRMLAALWGGSFENEWDVKWGELVEGREEKHVSERPKGRLEVNSF